MVNLWEDFVHDYEEDDNDDNDDEFIYTPSFKEQDDISMKILSSPQLKHVIECNLSCQQCSLWQWKSTVKVSQITYKLAMVINVVCNKGHKFSITPDHMDVTKKNSSTNFKINFYFIIAMQLLGKGLYSMTTLVGMLGICVSHGNYKIWKRIQNTIGEKQQELVR